MNEALTLEEFNALLFAEESRGTLLEPLRKLTALEKPEEVSSTVTEYLAMWAWGV